jgi:hypothetical protein
MLEAGCSLDLEGELVHKAPPPLFAGLVRLDQGMTGLVEVGGGVTSGRVVTTAHVTADPAHSEMDPMTSHAEAVLAAVRRRLDVLNLVEMVAELLGVRHGVSWYPASAIGPFGCRLMVSVDWSVSPTASVQR